MSEPHGSRYETERPSVTLVLGGSRSGKSSFAENLAAERHGSARVVYIATADAIDAEMASRIALHKSRRPPGWTTWEEDVASLPREIGNIARAGDILLLDCLTTYLSKIFMARRESDDEDEAAWREAENDILRGVEDIFSGFTEASRGTEKRLIVVSDEVGSGVVPPYRAGRRFRDAQGRANQIAARHADEAALMVAGIPLWIKRAGEITR